MPIAEYKCRHCKRTFAAWKDARACEKTHLRAVKTRPLTYGLVNPYPVTMEAEFPDGKTLTYIQEDEYWRR
jgi:hypothetical protein